MVSQRGQRRAGLFIVEPMLELHLVESNGARRLAALGEVPLMIGRSRNNDVVLNDDRISGRHARVWFDGERIHVRDLGSRNGTKINGAPLTGDGEAKIGDEILLGDLVLRIVQMQEPSEAEGPRPGPALAAALADLPPGLAGRLKRELFEILHDHDAVRWALQRLPALVAAGRRSAMLQLVVDQVRDLARAPAQPHDILGELLVTALVWSGDDERSALSGSAHAGDVTQMLPLEAVSTSIVGTVLREGRPVWFDDAQIDTQFGEQHSVVGLGLHSLGCVPLGRGAVLYLSDPTTGGRFDRVMRQRTEALCLLASAFIDRARPAPEAQALPGMVGTSQAMAEVFDSVRAFAPMPWPVLILGETGVGKERVARALHTLSGRDGPFEAVNCGALEPTLALSQLFGHEAGAFTGATARHIGYLERAGRGTLFLDEIGELPHAVQVRLLRVLADGEFHRLGGESPLKLHARLLAATHRPLDDPDRRELRDDLYHRLAACVVRVPPLADRPEDVELLAHHLLYRLLQDLPDPPQIGLSPAALRFLGSRSYPGNVRELENVLRAGVARALALSDSTLDVAHLAASERGPGTGPSLAEESVDDLKAATLAFQLRRVREMLSLCDDNRAEAARRLGVSRQFLYRLLDKEPGE